MLAVAEAQVVAHQTTDRRVPSLIATGNWAFFLFSYLSYISISGATLIRSLMEVQHNWFSTLQLKIGGLAERIVAEQA